MTTPLVIEHLEVIKQLHLGLAEAVEAIGQLTLDRREEALHHGVIVAVTAATHATDDAPWAQNRLVVLARVGAALVGVVQQTRIRTSVAFAPCREL